MARLETASFASRGMTSPSGSSEIRCSAVVSSLIYVAMIWALPELRSWQRDHPRQAFGHRSQLFLRRGWTFEVLLTLAFFDLR
jgi:hypothetical protein